ncbi:MAG: hypothetical protein U0350_10815 [Caldilineaceae bacterium]
MAQSLLTLPVSVEQIAVAVQQMSQEEQRRLLVLVPDLVKIAQEPAPPPTAPAQDPLAELRAQVLAALDHRPLSPDEPFFGGLTLGQYLDLSDQEQARLWDEWAGIDLMDMEEIEVSPDAVFA